MATILTNQRFDKRRLKPDLLERLHEHWSSSRGQDNFFFGKKSGKNMAPARE